MKTWHITHLSSFVNRKTKTITKFDENLFIKQRSVGVFCRFANIADVNATPSNHSYQSSFALAWDVIVLAVHYCILIANLTLLTTVLSTKRIILGFSPQQAETIGFG